MREAGTLERCLLAPDAGLQTWPAVSLCEADASRFGHGNPVVGVAAAAGPVRVYGPAGLLLGLGEVNGDRVLAARRVFARVGPGV
jgi:hypothetical protein